MRSEIFVRDVVAVADESNQVVASSPCRHVAVDGTNLMNKGKAQRDRRKLREKRRSTGVVYLPSAESTGGSTGEDDDEELIANEKEMRKNTRHNEQLAAGEPAGSPGHSNANNTSGQAQDPSRGNMKLQQTSASDLEADDEENEGSGTPSSTTNDEQPAASRVAQNATSMSTAATPCSTNTDGVLGLLERSLEENQKLSRLLEKRNQEIAALEAAVRQLQTQLGQVGGQASRLQEENAALIKAMGSLASTDD